MRNSSVSDTVSAAILTFNVSAHQNCEKDISLAYKLPSLSYWVIASITDQDIS